MDLMSLNFFFKKFFSLAKFLQTATTKWLIERIFNSNRRTKCWISNPTRKEVNLNWILLKWPSIDTFLNWKEKKREKRTQNWNQKLEYFTNSCSYLMEVNHNCTNSRLRLCYKDLCIFRPNWAHQLKWYWW